LEPGGTACGNCGQLGSISSGLSLLAHTVTPRHPPLALSGATGRWPSTLEHRQRETLLLASPGQQIFSSCFDSTSLTRPTLAVPKTSPYSLLSFFSLHTLPPPRPFIVASGLALGSAARTLRAACPSTSGPAAFSPRGSTSSEHHFSRRSPGHPLIFLSTASCLEGQNYSHHALDLAI